MKRIVVLGAVALLATGCLLQEKRHTLYLDPDGSVTWVVVQQDVRSDARDPRERQREEQAFLAAADAGQSDVARALEGLGARHISSRLIRVERPYVALTEARFSRIDRVIQSILDGLGATGRAELTWEGSTARLTITCDTEHHAEVEPDELLLALADDAERYRIVLTDGKFVDARGFALRDRDMVAVPLEPAADELERNGGAAILSLAWRTDGGR